ncbi:MAG: HNH endonuclease [Deltaproteobacteria bacterium]
MKAIMAPALRSYLRRQLFAGRNVVACCFCGKALTPRTATLEHILPRSRGGTDEPRNLTLSCAACNHGRGDMGFQKFRAKRERGGS